MKPKDQYDIAIIGGGITGLAHAYIAALKGYKVGVFERNSKPLGASVRNFGLIWPIGQPSGFALERALRSRLYWIGLAKKAKFWMVQNGSLHLAYHEDEMAVISEFEDNAHENGYQCELLDAEKILKVAKAVKQKNLLGGLWSSTELTIDPRQAIEKISEYLISRYGVTIHYDTLVSQITFPEIESGNTKWLAEQIYVCSGSDFETLYPEIFKSSEMKKCKLQMMKAKRPTPSWVLGPSLCGGLTLGHYRSFKNCSSLEKLKKRIKDQNEEYEKWGIHVLISQNSQGELIIGDSHQYDYSPDPFVKEEINQLILKYLNEFTDIPELTITERWHGIYSKTNNGKINFSHVPEEGVKIVNGVGGAGMTLSFGLAEKNINGL